MRPQQKLVPNSPGIRPQQRRRIRVRAIGCGSLFLVLNIAELAIAHVESSPAQIKPGKPATIAFTIPHGCNGSATIGVDIKLPTSISETKTVAPKGWTGAITNGVAMFSGGTLDAKTKGAFTITFTAPKSDGVLKFPTVQKCVKGRNSWIEPPNTDGTEPEYPIPTVTVSSKTAKSTKSKPKHHHPDAQK
jgi:periplasmic copper chaperone A